VLKPDVSVKSLRQLEIVTICLGIGVGAMNSLLVLPVYAGEYGRKDERAEVKCPTALLPLNFSLCFKMRPQIQ
jgi:hypothetical protein